MIIENQTQRGLRQSIDWKLIGCYLLLVIIGWLNIYASIHSSETTSILDFSTRSGKQFIWILTAIGLALLILFIIPPRWWEGFSPWIYAGVIFLLVAVIFLGVEVKGSKSWFEFGPVRFQPAEVSKISTALLLSTIMSQTGYKLTKPKDFFLTVAVIGLPMLVILAESETGSALVYFGFIFVLYMEGLSGWFLGAIGLIILLFITTLTLSPYTSIVILLGLLWLVNMFKSKKQFWRWLLIGGGVILLFSLLPWLWGLLTDAIQSRGDAGQNFCGPDRTGPSPSRLCPRLDSLLLYQGFPGAVRGALALHRGLHRRFAPDLLDRFHF